MTGNWRPEDEELAACAECREAAMFKPERDEGAFHRTRRLELSVGRAANNTATTVEKAVKIAHCAHYKGAKDFPNPIPRGSPIDMSRIPSPARRGAHSTPGFQAAMGKCTAFYSKARGPGAK
jgi:hypothetical protein